MYVSVRLADQAVDDLRTSTVELTSPAGRKLSMSHVLSAALATARRHPDDMLEALREQEK